MSCSESHIGVFTYKYKDILYEKILLRGWSLTLSLWLAEHRPLDVLDWHVIFMIIALPLVGRIYLKESLRDRKYI